MRTVIFDLDGTLVDTSADMIAAANVCFAEMGGDVATGAALDPARDAAVAFRGGRAMLTLGLRRHAGRADPDLVDAFYPRFLDAYGADIDTHSAIYPGAMAAVEALRAAGIAVGICTNKPEGLARTLLARLGIRDTFASLIGADTLPTRKPDPAPYIAAVTGAGGTVGRSLLVGDTVTDRKTARAAGVPCVLVTFGPDGDGVLDLAPEGAIAHFDGLAAEVARLLPRD